MLLSLQIQNLAILQQVEIDFSAGMNVLTGETGAGKSLLIEAIGFILGERADSSRVGGFADQLQISAEFNLSQQPQLLDWLTEADLAQAEDKSCFIRRSLSQQGRGKCFINERAVPLSRLAALGEQLADRLGQHAAQRLRSSESYTSLLDGFAGTLSLAKQVKQAYQQFIKAQQQYQQQHNSQAEREQRKNYLTYQLEELTQLNLSEHEWPELCAQQKRLANQAQLINQCAQLDRLLSDDGEGQSLTGLINQITSLTDQLPTDHQQSASIQQLFHQIQLLIDEGHSQISQLANQTELNPEQLQQTEARLGKLYDLARKHQINPEHLWQTQQAISEELAQLDNSDAELQRLAQIVEQQLFSYQKLSDKLSQQRVKACAPLAKAVTQIIQSLDMPHAQFCVALTATDDQQASAHGGEQATFTVITNPGQPAMPLHKIASGGELSRLNLAIQLCNSQQQLPSLMIFDEVDVGISGATAERVGQRLAELGKKTQVLCITHQAQVAACADHHYLMSKSQQAQQTCSDIQLLDKKQRIDELARLLGGVNISNKTRDHAKTLL